MREKDRTITKNIENTGNDFERTYGKKGGK